MNREWLVDVVARLPQGTVSRAWGWIARRRHPRLGVEALKRSFVAVTGIDMREAQDDVGEFECLEDLFVRRLKNGARRIDPDPEAVVSPVDGTIGAHGVVTDGTLFQVKGRSYSLAGLLRDDERAALFEGGPYLTVYLSPKDYHRIHSPVAGTVEAARVIPGRLMPVFPEALGKVDELLARNERIVSYVRHERAGDCAVVKVGATLVGRITVVYDETLRTNSGSSELVRYYQPPPAISKGAELGSFELGSTVVLVFEQGKVKFDGLAEGQALRMGERIGELVSPSKSKSAAKRTKTKTKTTKKKKKASSKTGAKTQGTPGERKTRSAKKGRKTSTSRPARSRASAK